MQLNKSRVGNFNVQFPKLGQGTPLSEFLGNLKAALPHALQGGRGVNLEYFGGKYLVSATGKGRSGGSSGSIELMQVTSIAADYIVCTRESGGSVGVARPHLLRQTGLDGATIVYDNGDSIEYTYDVTNPEWKRVADDGSTSLTQILTPNYYVDEYVYAAMVTTTGVASAPDWIDLNVCGRHWALQ